MKFSVIAIGDELLLGQVTDTNSGEIARILSPIGWEMQQSRVIGDDKAAIKSAIAEAFKSNDLVITTGGLGPTKDDITKSVLLEIFGGSLIEDLEVLKNVELIFEKRGLKLNDLTRSQAMVPESARIVQNRYGTAPIMWFEKDGKVLISMPGVPFETIGMMHSDITALISQRFAADQYWNHHTLIVSGITESDLAEKLADFEDSLPGNFHLAYLPNPGYIRLRLDSHAPADKSQDLDREADSLVLKLKELLGTLVVHDGDATPAQMVLERLREKGLTMSTAESCTGGNIAHCITSIAGASDCFAGGIVSYSNEVKMNLLGVDKEALDNYGAVSEAVVRQMAEGAAKATGTDCAVATSGIAGPGGGTPSKPVGTVWIAAHTPKGTVSRLLHLPGNRARVIDRSTTEALLLLLVQLS